MTASMTACERGARGKWFFLGAFIFSCFLFWWLHCLLVRFFFHLADPVENGTLLASIAALALFAAGYLLPVSSRRKSSALSVGTFDACESLAYTVSFFLFFPTLLIAMQLWISRAGVAYGMADSIPWSCQALLYTHLFFGFMFFGAAEPEKQGWRKPLIIAIQLTLPRLLISLHGGRFMLAQAVVPITLIALARGWLRLTGWRMVQIVCLGVVILLVPAITRGDAVLGQGEFVEWLAGGSTLGLYQDHRDDNMEGYCSPFLVGFTSKLIPYGLLDECLTDFGDRKNEPATLDRILAVNAPGSLNGTFGPGANYLLDLYLFGGLFAVFAGSAFFGLTCRYFWVWIGRRSLFSGIWAECLTRALFAPRSDLGYVYERIPSLVLTTLFIVFVVHAWRLLAFESGPAARFSGPLSLNQGKPE